MRPLLALALLSLLAGCASPASPITPPPVSTNATEFSAAYAINNSTVVPPQEIRNATLGAEHQHDLWKGREQIVLLDATVPGGMCEGPQDAALLVAQEAFQDQVAAEGCARFYLPEGVVVPEGTGDLEIHADANGAMKMGGIELQFRNKAREGEGEVSTTPDHTWHVNLTSADWDLPHANATTWVLYVASHGNGAVMNGEVKARIVAHRSPGWQPVLAVAHVDHWKLPHLHDLVAPGVMRLYDGPANVTNIDPARFQGQNLPEDVHLADIIAPGATHLTIVVDDESSTCAAPMECHLVPQLVVGGYERTRFGNLTLIDGARRVYTWAVPTEVPEDSVYANASTTKIAPRIEGCAPGQDASCGVLSIASTSATARVLVLAWKGDVDATVLKTIANAKTHG